MSSKMPFSKSGKIVGRGADKKVVLGFKPRKVEVHNVTDRISAVKLDTMPTNDALVRAANGDGTINPYISIESDGFVVKAALAVNGKELHYYAEEGTNE
jgi:hypothetical protein